MITIDLWKCIITYIERVKENRETNGILLCGSLPNNTFTSGSDIDILFLVSSGEFLMETVLHDNRIFDMMTVHFSVLSGVLGQESPLSDILSLSFGLSRLVVEDSPELRSIMAAARDNIASRGLRYVRPETREPHRSGERFTLRMVSGVYRLAKGDDIVV